MHASKNGSRILNALSSLQGITMSRTNAMGLESIPRFNSKRRFPLAIAPSLS
jgi:hypothetical protein